MNKQKQSGWKQPQPSLLALFLPSNFPSAGWLSGRGAWSCIPATDGRPCQGENNLCQHAPPTCRSHAPPIPGIRRRISQLERVRNHLLPAHPTRRGLCLDGSVWVLDESLEDGALSAAGVRGNEGSRSDQLFFLTSSKVCTDLISAAASPEKHLQQSVRLRCGCTEQRAERRVSPWQERPIEWVAWLKERTAQFYSRPTCLQCRSTVSKLSHRDGRFSGESFSDRRAVETLLLLLQAEPTGSWDMGRDFGSLLRVHQLNEWCEDRNEPIQTQKAIY